LRHGRDNVISQYDILTDGTCRAAKTGDLGRVMFHDFRPSHFLLRLALAFGAGLMLAALL